MASNTDVNSQLGKVNEIELRSLPLGEFVLDSGEPPSLEIKGPEAKDVKVSIHGTTLRIEGTSPVKRTGIQGLNVSGSYITGSSGLSPLMSPGTDPLRIRTGAGNLLIRLDLPPGTGVTIKSDFGTFQTRSPLGPEGRQERLAEKASSRELKANEKRDKYLGKAADKREKAKGKLQEAAEAEAAGKMEKAESKRRDAATAQKEAEEYEKEAGEAYEELMREARQLKA